ncbi:hypothetical protein Q3G72_005849 [Acer saccharum]|nr:hypothetical protein Q3G72_005849 [Acer saccharum]
MAIAVKWFNQEGFQGHKEWLAEINYLGQLSHPNLVKLIGHLTTKTDIYSFGVVLLEMLSGRRAIDKNRPSGEHNLVEWAKPYLINKRRIFRVLDPRLEGQYTLPLAQKAATLAHQCLSIESKSRPDMDEIVKVLEELQDMSKAAKKEHHGKGHPHSNNRPTSNPRPSASPIHA